VLICTHVGSVPLACQRPLNARLATGEGLSFSLFHTCWHPCAFASPLQLVVEPSGAAGLAAVLADEWASACPGAAAAKWVDAGRSL
jgi:hypothetical protein